MEEKQEKSLRYNEGKLQWHNFPMFLIRPLIEVSDFGAKKYSKYNYLKGAPLTQYLDSLKRHIDSFEDPKVSDDDKESGLNHLAHAAWNALVAFYIYKNKPQFDDRYKG